MFGLFARPERLWQRDSPEAPLGRTLFPDDLLFTAAAMPIPLSDAFTSWLRAWIELRQILELFFATRDRSRLFEEHRLLNLTHALEAFHRIRIGGGPHREELRAERVQRVLSVLSAKDRRWARWPLERANEFTLAQRIAALVTSHRWMLDDVVRLTPGQCGDYLAPTRNYHIHLARRATRPP